MTTAEYSNVRRAMEHAEHSDYLEGIPTNTNVPVRTVSTDRYTSRAFHELEKGRLWSRVWQMVCRVEELEDEGAYFEYEIADQSIVVVRGSTGTLNAWFNACRHRGTQLVRGCGKATEFRCPYHAWTYALDGSLKHLTSPYEYPATTDFDYGLVSCQVDTWGGFIFVNPDPSAMPLQEFLAPVPQLTEDIAFAAQEMEFANSVVVPCNWKTALEGFLEGYHVPFLHPQLATMNDDLSLYTREYGQHASFGYTNGSASKRLGDVPFDVIIESLMATKEELGLIDDAEAATKAMLDMTPELPDGISSAAYFAGLRREAAIAAGWDVEAITPERWELTESWLIFPNLVLHAAIGDTIGWRARPNGDDPNSCILEHMAFRWLPKDHGPKPGPRNLYQDWRDYEAGTILHDQDFPNASRVGNGLRSWGSDRILFSDIQEAHLYNWNKKIDRFVDDLDKPEPYAGVEDEEK